MGGKAMQRFTNGPSPGGMWVQLVHPVCRNGGFDFKPGRGAPRLRGERLPVSNAGRCEGHLSQGLGLARYLVSQAGLWEQTGVVADGTPRNGFVWPEQGMAGPRPSWHAHGGRGVKEDLEVPPSGPGRLMDIGFSVEQEHLLECRFMIGPIHT